MGTKRTGFTLIELLVVIAIIGVLASVVLAALNTSRAKARDARKMQDFRSIQTALHLYYDTYKSMPPNYAGESGFEWESGTGYSQSMQHLVTAGFLPAVPKSPGGPLYAYYNYGPNAIGALLVTRLEAAPDSVNGISPSCRPWAASVNNWCKQESSKYYCICTPY